jgi:hypothetical protein
LARNFHDTESAYDSIPPYARNQKTKKENETDRLYDSEHSEESVEAHAKNVEWAKKEISSKGSLRNVSTFGIIASLGGAATLLYSTLRKKDKNDFEHEGISISQASFRTDLDRMIRIIS